MLAADGQGQVWVGQSEHYMSPGLSRLSPNGQWTHYTTQNSGLPADGISALAVDGQDRLWVATSAAPPILAWGQSLLAGLGR